MDSKRPLPVPPYPGIIPYHVDSPDHIQPHHNPPQLLGMEQRPISVGSFGPSSCQTLPGVAEHSLSEEQVRDKFYKYWQKQQVGS